MSKLVPSRSWFTVQAAIEETPATARVPSLVVIATGVVGSRWRGGIAPSGAIVPADGGPALRWLIAADDRWHDPEQEITVRQSRRRGTPVVDTRVRVPGGDIEQTIWTVADHGGLTLVELRNESPLPVAIALTRRDVLTVRAPSTAAVAGIDAPADALVLPLGHRASITVALAHDGRGADVLPAGLPTADTVADAWVARADSASRLVLPDDELVERVRAVRVELMLAGVDDVLTADPVRALVALGELRRVGELAVEQLDEVVPHVAALAERVLRGAAPGTRHAMHAAVRLLAAAGEQRAVADVRRAASRRGAGGDEAAPSFDDLADGDPLLVAAVEAAICNDGVVFAGGLPAGWAGQNLEAHGLPLGDRGRLSLAVRWHGRNPALLWDIETDTGSETDTGAGAGSGIDTDTGGAAGDGAAADVRLSSPLTEPAWSTAAPRGEALLVLPG